MGRRIIFLKQFDSTSRPIVHYRKLNLNQIQCSQLTDIKLVSLTRVLSVPIIVQQIVIELTFVKIRETEIIEIANATRLTND